MSEPLVASDRAPGLFVAPETRIPDDALIAPHVTIYRNVVLGAGVTLDEGAVLGRPQRIGIGSRAPRAPGGAQTFIGDGCRVGSATVVVAGARVCAGAFLSDLVLVREDAVVGEEAMIGRGTSISFGSAVGDRTRIQNNCLVTPGTTIAEDVSVGPFVTFMNDPTMGRSAADASPGRIQVERRCRIGTGAIIFPPAILGEESVVGAAAMVRADVPARTVVTGTPATSLRAVRADEMLERWRPQ